jgi:hypothetical protein
MPIKVVFNYDQCFFFTSFVFSMLFCFMYMHVTSIVGTVLGSMNKIVLLFFSLSM